MGEEQQLKEVIHKARRSLMQYMDYESSERAYETYKRSLKKFEIMEIEVFGYLEEIE